MKKSSKILLPLGFVAGNMTLVAGWAHAAGYDLPDQDAFVIGRGMAFVATADNPAAIYYNPAGITQLAGQNLRAGIYGIDLEPTFTATSGANAGSEYHNDDKLHAIPQFYYTYTAADSPWSFGLGLYSPFGLGVKWPQDTGFRTLATESSLSTLAFNPVVAFKVSPTFSIGGGVSAVFAMTDLRQGLFDPSAPTDGFRFDGDGWDVAYNLGMLWKVHEKVSIGVTFRSGSTVKLRGHTEDYIGAFAERTSAHTDLPLPYKAIFGISYRPTPAWNLEFNADYTDWSSVKSLVVEQSAPTALGQTIPLVLNWQSSWYYEFGATRYLDHGWHVSAGYIFNENSVPDANYTPLATDLDRHFLSVGLGHKGQRLDFDVAYQFGFAGTRTVSGSAPSPVSGQTTDGKYDYTSHAVAVSMQWHF